MKGEDRELRRRAAEAGPGNLSRADRICSVLLFAGAVALYLPSLRYEFTIDDPLVTVLNRNMPTSTGDFLAPFRTSLYSGTEMGPTNAYLFRPLLMTSLSINYRLAGNTYDPFSFHLANIVLFGLSVVVVFLLARAMLREGRSGLAAVLTATLFMVFPSHLESVCNVKNREEILAFLFGGVSWLLILGKPGEGTSRTTARLVAAPLLFLMALLSKESALLLLPCMLIWEYVKGDRSRARRTLPAWALSMAVATAMYLGMRHRAVGSWLSPHDANTFFGPGEGALVRVLSSARIFVKYYLWDQVFALKLDPNFSTRFILPLENPPTFIGVACLVALAGALVFSVWEFVRVGSPWAFWVIFFLVNSFFVFHFLPLGTAGAFRLMFTPSLALCVLLALGIVSLGRATAERIERVRGRPGLVAAGLLVPVALCYGLTTLNRMGIWKDDGTIYSYSAAVGRGNPMSYYAAGQHYGQKGQAEKKLDYYGRALRIFIDRERDPEVFDERSRDAFSVVATEIAYARVDRNPREALDLANVALGQFSRLQALRKGRIDPNVAGPYYVKALAYRNLGDVRGSIETCRAALAITPHAGIEQLLRSLTGGG